MTTTNQTSCPADRLRSPTDAVRALGEIDSTYANAWGRPVYVLQDDGSLPQYLQLRSGTAAQTSTFYDLVARRHLQENGQWRGRGLAMTIRPFSPQQTAGWFALLVHEACHDAARHVTEPRKAIYGSVADACRLSSRHEYIEQTMQTGAEPGFEAQPDPQRDQKQEGHHVHFVRAVCHASFRARAWFGNRSPKVFEVANYGLSTTTDYSNALAEEVLFRSNEPISSLVQDQPPRAFLELWKKDTAGASAEAKSFSTCDRWH